MGMNDNGVEGLRQRVNGNGNLTKIVITDEGKKVDQLLDKHDRSVLVNFWMLESPQNAYIFEV
jgi:hypothetical protein